MNAIQSEWNNFWLLLLLLMLLLVMLAQCETVVRQFFQHLTCWSAWLSNMDVCNLFIFFYFIFSVSAYRLCVCILPPNWNDLTKYAIFLVSIVCFLTSIVLYNEFFFFLWLFFLFKWFITYFCRTTHFFHLFVYSLQMCDSQKKCGTISYLLKKINSHESQILFFGSIHWIEKYMWYFKSFLF